SIKIFDPNPDIEFVETGNADPDDPAKGKYEIAVQSDKLQINGRKTDNSGFETILVFERRAIGGNMGFWTTSQFGAGQGVIAIANAVAAPTVNPKGGGVLYVEDGALMYRGSSGTVTTLAPACRLRRPPRVQGLADSDGVAGRCSTDVRLRSSCYGAGRARALMGDPSMEIGLFLQPLHRPERSYGDMLAEDAAAVVHA